MPLFMFLYRSCWASFFLAQFYRVPAWFWGSEPYFFWFSFSHWKKTLLL